MKLSANIAFLLS